MGEGRGKYQTQVGSLLSELFPGDIICEEFPCVGDNLTLDFFIPRKMIAVEVQGRQHKQFVEFFHRDKDGFLGQLKRDKRKSAWCQLNNIRLVKIDTGESKENIINLLLDE
jgi:hypothetical protein